MIWTDKSEESLWQGDNDFGREFEEGMEREAIGIIYIILKYI